ncbi:MAG TPA: hypothetical protein VFR80_13670, partial [Pyrinomonadaceae bacterium]|nr:hypothetical protein [Pyrinomonadaceae bacterium]
PHNLFGTPIFTMEKLLKARRKEMKDPSNTEDTRGADSTTLDYSKLESVVGRLADAILQSKEPPPDDKGTLQADYQITVDMVKAFSDIRFRCLVFVTAIITVASALLPGTGDPGTRIALGLVGFLATLGIAVYELRNSQLYEAAIHRATILETKLASLRATEHSKQGGLFNERPPYVDDKIWKSLLPEQQTALKKSKRVPFMSFWFVKVKHDFGLAIIYGAALAGWVYIVASGLRTFLLSEGFWSATVHDLIRRLPAVIALLAFGYSVSRFVHHDKNRFRPEPPKKTHAKRSEPELLAPPEVGRSQ